MKAILIVFLAFQYDAMPATQKIDFDSMKQCEVAREALTLEYKREFDREKWGRARYVAVCVSYK